MHFHKARILYNLIQVAGSNEIRRKSPDQGFLVSIYDCEKVPYRNPSPIALHIAEPII
jgi:hypothetical protein